MGCDIHPFIEVKSEEGEWELRDDKGRYWRMFEKENLSYEEKDKRTPFAIRYLGRRNYRLFAALADVRNGGDGVEPLFPRRGMPINISGDVSHYMVDEWGGDLHSHSHFTLEELMSKDLNKDCTRMEMGLFPTQYADWKDTGVLPESSLEEWEIRNLAKDPIHREVSEEEMMLLLASGDPDSLTKMCDKFLPRSEGVQVLAGPYVKTYVPVSYRRLLPALDELIEALKTYGPPDRVRVVMAFDN